MSYQAIVTRIKTKPHPNADRIQLGTVLGTYQVVVGLDTQDNELGVYFPVDGLLSDQFIQANRLYSKSAVQKLGLSDPGHYGFFDHHRRIRAQKFRGEKSDGFWVPLKYLADFSDQWEADFTLPEGHTFTTLNGHLICEKWVSRARSKGPSTTNPRLGRKGELLGFPKHMDTDQWAYYKDQIESGSLITVSEKLHGTSHRVSLTWNPDRKWWQFWKPKHVVVHGSRNVVLTDHSGRQSFYGTDEFRLRAVPHAGRLGEVLYGEIVGWVDHQTPIMPGHSVDPKELPQEHAQYQGQVNFHYGCGPGEARFYVYRIVQFNEHGEAVELSDPQVRRRAKDLGYECPPLIGAYVRPEDWDAECRTFEDLKILHATGDPSRPSMVASNQMAEGCVIRVDDPKGHTKFYKSKSFAFKLLEGIIKSQDQYEDMEESS